MVRSISNPALAALQEQYGTEPINVVRIYWETNTYTQYSDREYANSKPTITNISAIDDIINIQGSSSSSTMSITLFDLDRVLLDLINRKNIVNVKVEVYQTFLQLAESDMFLIYYGFITTPINYSEGDTALSFQIESKIKSRQVGFSPEEGQFKDVQDNLIGEVWPLCFGSPIHVKAALGRTTLRGTSATRFVIPDTTLAIKQRLIRISKQNLKNNHKFLLDLISQGENLTPKPIDLRDTYADLIIKEDQLKQKLEDMKDEATAIQNTVKESIDSYNADPSSDNYQKVQTLKNSRKILYDLIAGKNSELKQTRYLKSFVEAQLNNAKYGFNFIGKIRQKISTLLSNYDELEQQGRIADLTVALQALESCTKVLTTNGEKFPQNVELTVDLGNQSLKGYFNGRVFHVTALVPSYIGIQCANKQDTELNTFYVSDPTLRLAGKFALLPSGDIIRINQQTGTKCYFELRTKIKETTVKRSEIDTDNEILKRARDGLKDLLTGNETDEELIRIMNEIPKALSQQIFDKLTGGNSHKQLLQISFNAVGGTFKILVEDFETEELAYNCTAKNVKDALMKMPLIIGRRLFHNVTSDDFIKVTPKDPTKTRLNQTPFIIEFDAKMLPMPSMSCISTNLKAANYAQKLVVFNSALTNSGTCKIKLPNGEVTRDIKHNSNSFQVYNELLNTSYFDSTNLRVTGGPLGTIGGSSVIIEDLLKRQGTLEIVSSTGDVKFEISTIYTNNLNSGTPTDYHPLASVTWIAEGECAQEYTKKEIEKKLQEAVGRSQYDDQLKALKKNMLTLMNGFDKAVNADNWDTFQETGKYLRDYVRIMRSVQIPQSIVQEAYRLISDKEYQNLFDAEILNYMIWKRSMYPIEKEVKEQEDKYYILGHQVTNLLEVAGTVLPSWLINYIGIEDDQEFIRRAHRLPQTEAEYNEPGTEIKLSSDYQEKYVANIVPGTIHGVYAFKSVEGIKSLSPIPSSYYVKNESENYGNLNLVTLTFRRPLSEYGDEGWEDDIYVTLTSSVGPNVADILQHIINTYTTSTANFSAVRDKYTNYPAHFAVTQKIDALKLCADIAWQSRSILIFKNGIPMLKYYAERPTPVATITASDINERSLKITTTDNMNIVTKFIAKWKPHNAVTKENKIIFRHNVSVFDENEEEYDFYIYNDGSLVSKSATFWMIRKANMFKIIDFTMPMHRLNIENQDCVTIDLPNNLVANGPILGEIIKYEYNSDNNEINVQVWLPILFGSNTEYEFTFPANLSVDTEFPSTDIILSGNAGSPLGQRVPNGTAFDPFGNPALFLRPNDFGDLKISDGRDSLPSNPANEIVEEDFDPSQFNKIIVPPLAPLAGPNDTDFDISGMDPDLRAESLIAYGTVEDLESIKSIRPPGSINIISVQRYNVRLFNGNIVVARQMEIRPDERIRYGTSVLVVYSPENGEYQMQASTYSSGRDV